MERPKIYYEEKDNEVALAASFVPEIIPSYDESKHRIQVVTDEIPEPQEVAELSKPSFYVFIIDRSGSMSGSPMELTKQALLLFLQSLP